MEPTIRTLSPSVRPCELEGEDSLTNTLIYATGDQADDVLNSFKLSTTQLK